MANKYLHLQLTLQIQLGSAFAAIKEFTISVKPLHEAIKSGVH